MADPETAAVIAQMRKLLWLAKEAPRPLTDDQLLPPVRTAPTSAESGGTRV